MTIPFKSLILRGVAVALVAALGYTGYMLSRLAPIATIASRRWTASYGRPSKCHTRNARR